MRIEDAAGNEILTMEDWKAIYDESVDRKNYRGYIHFMNKVDAVDWPLDFETAIGHKLNLGGKELIWIHEYFQW